MIKDLYRTMQVHHTGKENAIKMTRLADIFDVSEREIRKVVHCINYNKVLCNGWKGNNKILGDNVGYYMISDAEELKRYRNKVVKRIKQSVALLKAIDGDNKENQLTFDFDKGELEMIKEHKEPEQILVSQRDMAKMLGTDEQTFRKMLLQDKNLPFIIVHKSRKFYPKDVINYLRHKTEKIKDE